MERNPTAARGVGPACSRGDVTLVCRDFRAAIDNYVDGSLDAGGMRDMDDHAAGCSQCRADLSVARLLARRCATEPGPATADEDLTPDELARVALSPSVTRIAHGIIAQALRDNATEILLDPVTEGLRVAYRVEQELREVITMPVYIRQPLTARLKQMADLCPSDRSTPQQGDIPIRMNNRRYTVRLITHPEGRAERIVMEIEYPDTQEKGQD